jgi:hypothetical protein
MKTTKVPTRLLVHAGVLLCLSATTLSLTAAPKYKAPERARERRNNERQLVRRSVFQSKVAKRQLTRTIRGQEARRAVTSWRAEVLKRHLPGAEDNSVAALRARVQGMIARDETAGEDEEVRRVAVAALGNHAGTVVVMDPNTGRVYSIVNQQWALRGGFKPCSTIKLVTGLAGLNENLIETPELTNISTNARMDLTSALAHSNNSYFQQVGGRVGFDKLLFYARQLGLGEKTGINVGNESAGRTPLYKSGYAVNHMSSHGDDFEVTALQLATLVSAMSNGGKLLTPYVPQVSRAALNVKPRVRRQVGFAPGVMSQMVPGMVGAVNYGTGKRAFDPLETIAGKTGTCIQNGNWVGLFASYAPLARPLLAVVVIGSGVDAQGHFPAAVAGEIYRNLNHRFGMIGNTQVAKSRDSIHKPTRVQQPRGDADMEDTAEGLDQLDLAVDRLAPQRATVSAPFQSRLINSAALGNPNVKRVLLAQPDRSVAVVTVANSTRTQAATRPRRVGQVFTSAVTRLN